MAAVGKSPMPVKIVGGLGPVSSPASLAKERDYQAEDDHRTLQRADEVRQDPSRMKRAKRHARNLVRQNSRLYGGRNSR